MSMNNAAAQDCLQLVFENVDWPNVGDAAGLQNSAATGSFTIALHTGDPGETGTQLTNEATYTSYARQTVARGAAEWTVTATDPPTASNDNVITFPTATGGSDTITHFSVGNGVSNEILFSGALGASLAVSSGVQPQFNAGQLQVSMD